MRALLRAYPTLLRVGLAEAIAYRAEMVVWMLTTTMPLVSLALWHAVAADGPIGPSKQLTQTRLVAYFLAALIVRQLTGSWVVWEMNQEIRTGKLSLRLLRPIHPLIAYSAENLAALPLRGALSLPIAVVMLFTVGGAQFSHDWAMAPVLAAALLGAWLITFFIMCAIGSLGFFMESSTAVFEVYLGLFFALSGYLFPLELLAARAPWVMAASRALPFYYTLGFPIEVMLGLHSRADALRALAVEWGYVVGLFAAARWLWALGMRRFNAYGA
jgi:ABC-2 type transport system permease protein